MNVAKGRDNVTQLRPEEPSSVPSTQGGNGGGDNFGEKLATLEERVRHLATSAEVEKVRTEVAKVATSVDYLKWMIATIIGGILLIIGKLFLST